MYDIRTIVELGYLVFSSEGFRVIITTPNLRFNNRSGLRAVDASQPTILLGELVRLYEGHLGT